MMICPETYYLEYIQGKTADEIMSIIRRLKREITRLKNTIENPEYVCKMNPSKKEIKAEEFDANIEAICKIIFSIGGSFRGYETRIYTIDGDELIEEVENSLVLNPSSIDEPMMCEFGKEDLLDGIRRLHIGEWLRHYSPRRWNMYVMDGTQWSLEIQFSNGYKTVKIDGDNDYPYNFDELQDLLGIYYDIGD